LDLDLGKTWCSPPLFFLSSSSIALVVVVGFGREELDHFVCTCHYNSLSYLHRFGCKKVKSLLLLGSLNSRPLCGLCGDSWSL
jgi:hypothetical protein